jgi:hypothetical protein
MFRVVKHLPIGGKIFLLTKLLYNPDLVQHVFILGCNIEIAPSNVGKTYLLLAVF